MAFSFKTETDLSKITAEPEVEKKPQNPLKPVVGFTYKNGTYVPQILLLSESKIRKPKNMVRFSEVEEYPEGISSPESPSAKRPKLANSYRTVQELLTESDSSDEAHCNKRARVAYSQGAIDEAAGSSRSNSSSDEASLHSKSKRLNSRRIRLDFRRRSRPDVLETRKDDVLNMTKRMKLDDDEELPPSNKTV